VRRTPIKYQQAPRHMNLRNARQFQAWNHATCSPVPSAISPRNSATGNFADQVSACRAHQATSVSSNRRLAPSAAASAPAGAVSALIL